MNDAFPIQVTFHGTRHSDDIERLVRGHVDQLTKFHPRIHGCRVVITPAEGHAHGGGYRVELRVAIPGNDVVVGHQHDDPAHADMAVAVADAFSAAERMLQDCCCARRSRERGR
jgi:hypothetical protein